MGSNFQGEKNERNLKKILIRQPDQDFLVRYSEQDSRKGCSWTSVLRLGAYSAETTDDEKCFEPPLTKCSPPI